MYKREARRTVWNVFGYISTHRGNQSSKPPKFRSDETIKRDELEWKASQHLRKSQKKNSLRRDEVDHHCLHSIQNREGGHEVSYTDGLPVFTDHIYRKQKKHTLVPPILALLILTHFCPRPNTRYCSNLEKRLLGYHLVLPRRKMEHNMVPSTQKS